MPAVPGRAADHLIGLGHRDVLVVAVEPPAPSIGLDPDGVMGRRCEPIARPSMPSASSCRTIT